MACEKYSGSMTDAALGVLPPGEERELCAHAKVCADCRGKWDAARALAAAVDGGVASLVAGEPSPEFQTRLRARLADEPVPSAWPFLTWPVWSAGALAVAAAVLVVLLIRWPGRVSTTPEIAANTSAPVENSAAAPVEPVRAPVPVPVHAPATQTDAPRRAVASTRRDAQPFPFEVLVPKGQLSAAVLLSEAASDGRIDGAQLSAFAELTGKPLEVKALQIAPLENPGTDEPAGADSTRGSGRF